MARGADFDLGKELAKPSFTPAQRDAPALVELVVGGEEPTSERAAVALAGLADVGRKAIEARLGGRAKTADIDVDAGELGDASTARLVGALGLLARRGDAVARTEVIARTTDPHVRVRRAAILALGKLGADKRGIADEAAVAEARAALLARWDAGDAPPDERRALVEALGKLGGDEARARLEALQPGVDAELARRRDRALLIGERDAKRGEESAIAIDAAPPSPVTVRLHCKEGLAGLLRDDLAARGLRGTALRDDTVELSLARPWSALHASRLWIDGGIRVPLAGDSASAIADAITSPGVRALLRAWTMGPIRWRLAVRGGHQRSLVWRVAKEVGARAKELVNDPSQTTWDIAVDTSSTDRALELVPRRAADPRFSWRVAEVPAASHPTVAAALALVAGAKEGDRVWDPFCGSAAELVERARLGPYRSIVGSDIDDAALTAAQKNLDAAGVTATLVRDDARTYSPDRPGTIDLVITNPPLGSRVHVDAASLLVTTLPNIAKHLAPGGRLVWITPAPRTTAMAAERLGLRMTRRFAVDLGGVRGQLERWER